MPGVPTSRGCEACRKQKKKCDQIKPACSRCTRLRIYCVGAGVRRFKFQVQVLSVENTVKVKGGTVIRRTPSAGTSLLLSSFVDAIKPSTDIRYNLAWTYGSYLEGVPRRLGTNDALDSSAKALVVAHTHYCSGAQLTVEVLDSYTTALQKLRKTLDDPAEAQAVETLCAVMLLLLCQGFVGIYEGRQTGHVEGIAQLLKARGFCSPKNDFENMLFLTLRGPVIFEGLMNNKINFSTREWEKVAEDGLKRGLPEDKLLLCLVRLIPLIQGGRGTCNNAKVDTSILMNLRNDYQISKDALTNIQKKRTKIQTRLEHKDPEFPAILLHQGRAYLLRSYGFCMTVTIALNCALQALDPEERHLEAEMMFFANEMLRVADLLADQRPLSNQFIFLCLSTAWAGTNDQLLRLKIEAKIWEHRHPALPLRDVDSLLDELEWTAQRLRLLDPDPNGSVIRTRKRD